MKRFQYYKVAAATPHVNIGNPKKNSEECLRICKQLPKDTQCVVFPELCLSGYTCQDLFYEDLLLEQSKEALIDFTKKQPKNLLCIVGLPLVIENRLYNCAAACFNGKILGIQVKTYIPNYNEYYEARWFTSAKSLNTDSIDLDGYRIPVSNHILFEDLTTKACIGIEICEDLWVSIPISSTHALAGANIICNPSASNEIIAKKEYRRSLIQNQSARTYTAYIYASAGVDESSSDLIFSGNNVIAETGSVLSEMDFNDTKDFIISEIDLQTIQNDRLHFKTSMEDNIEGYTKVTYQSEGYDSIELERSYNAYPFVPFDLNQRIERCQSILTIQAHGLATRLRKIHCEHVVIGISGGLDSTLALLVCEKAFKINQFDPKGIHAITMPGFGTSTRTKSNAEVLMDLIGASSEKISIVDAVNQHFKDIHHDPEKLDITYENSQARERTQILMDLSNQYNAIVVGTGDLSELALGWCTYNGDHMSMYAVNASVPKTLVRYIVETRALQAKDEGEDQLYTVLMDICDTPVSPELLPLDQNGKIQQKTEEVLGSYDLHDFFLYHMLRHHSCPSKIYALACKAFDQVKEESILKALKTFYQRFFAQQFKRNCMPDGVKVGSICFSPRGDWRMPSDASREAWFEEVEKL